jgi:RimJ/RimL family protein N-acetyltransferase
MSEVRELCEKDGAAVEAFLAPQADGYLHMLSNLTRVGLTPGQQPYQGRYVGAFAGGRLTGVAALFWNGFLTLCAPEETATLAGRAVGPCASKVTGLYGPADQAARAMQALGVEDAALGSSAELELMALDLDGLVRPPVLDDGDLRTRLVRSSEVDLVANWLCRFEVEVFNREEQPRLHGEMLETVQRRRREHALWVLERRGQLVACCGFSARYRDRVQVGPVWVPPGLRNAGYARAVVAGALLKAQADGTRRAVLLGDDPAAKRAYLALGFERVGERVLAFLDRAKFGQQRRLTA